MKPLKDEEFGIRDSQFEIGEMRRYEVAEHFGSWQGEGSHAGCAAYFIRLFGCPIRCEWCDSAGTWSRSAEDAGTERMSAADLAEKAAAATPDFVVITGGEPTIHDLAPLCDALHAKKLRAHLETSGAFPIRGNVDWITISPKVRRPPLAENLARASELKLIVTAPEDLVFWAEKIPRGAVPASASVWLHPEWSQRENPVVLNAISDWVRARGFPFRAGWQLHKLYSVR